MNKENKEKVKSDVCQIKNCGRLTHKKSKYCIFHAKPKEKTEEEFKEALKKYIKEIEKSEKAEYNFEHFIFVGDIYFKDDFNIENFINGSFENCIFYGDVGFYSITFEGVTTFEKTKFNKNVDFSFCKFLEYSIFDDSRFNYYVNFTSTYFKNKTTFNSVRFNGNVDFSTSTFKDIVLFNRTVFKNNVNFDFTKYYGVVTFIDSAFNNSANFIGARFEDILAFSAKKFLGILDFSNVIFERDVTFKNIDFKDKIEFSHSIFKGIAFFYNNTFAKEVDFSYSSFLEKGNFYNNTSNAIVSFLNSDFSKRSGIHFKIKNQGSISFEFASLENTIIMLDLEKNATVDFKDTVFKNTDININQINNHIIQEKNNNFIEAKYIFQKLKENYHRMGFFTEELWALEKEKEMERMHFSLEKQLIDSKEKFVKEKGLKKIIYKIRIRLNWLFSISFIIWFKLNFINFLCGYGYKPKNVIRFSILLILFFTLIFMSYGINTTKNMTFESDNFYKMIDNDKIILNVNVKDKVINNFSDCFYFSIVTFTTLGYGDLRPTDGACKIFVGIEAFSGAFMIALFVYTIVRRFG